MSEHESGVGRPPLITSAAAPANAAAGVAAASPRREQLSFGTIVIVGGGCYGSYYLRQLRRGAAAGALAWKRLLVVDRSEDCQVARESAGAPAPTDGCPPHEMVVAEWAPFFRAHLDAAAGGDASLDAIVPSPLMPHLLYDWLLDRARRRWPDRPVDRVSLQSAPAVPWTRAGNDGTQYVSFAEWMCPINCIEPARCPHTRGPRDWSMPVAVRAFVDAEQAAGRAVQGPCILHCTHRAYGVGMIDTRDVIDADRFVAAAGTRGAADVLIGTASHCHGALGILAIGPLPQ